MFGFLAGKELPPCSTNLSPLILGNSLAQLLHRIILCFQLCCWSVASAVIISSCEPFLVVFMIMVLVLVIQKWQWVTVLVSDQG